MLNFCARAYLEYYRSQFKKHAWACEYTEHLIQSEATAGLLFIEDLLLMCQDEPEIAYIASGPLEDFLHRYISTSTKEKIEKCVCENPLMRLALRYVWSQEQSPVNIFINNINTKMNFIQQDSFELYERKPRVADE